LRDTLTKIFLFYEDSLISLTKFREARHCLASFHKAACSTNLAGHVTDAFCSHPIVSQLADVHDAAPLERRYYLCFHKFYEGGWLFLNRSFQMYKSTVWAQFSFLIPQQHLRKYLIL